MGISLRSPQKITRPTVRSKTQLLGEKKVCFITWYTSPHTLINVELQIHPQTIKSRFYETLQFTESLRNLLQLIRLEKSRFYETLEFTVSSIKPLQLNPLSIHIKNSTIKRGQFNVAQSHLGRGGGFANDMIHIFM